MYRIHVDTLVCWSKYSGTTTSTEERSIYCCDITYIQRGCDITYTNLHVHHVEHRCRIQNKCGEPADSRIGNARRQWLQWRRRQPLHVQHTMNEPKSNGVFEKYKRWISCTAVQRYTQNFYVCRCVCVCVRKVTKKRNRFKRKALAAMMNLYSMKKIFFYQIVENMIMQFFLMRYIY